MSRSPSSNMERFLDSQFPDYMKKAMVNACSLVQETATEKAPVDTGNLKRSIDFQVDEDGRNGTIYSNAEYAPYVEIGTGIKSTMGTGRKTPWRYKRYDGKWVTTTGNRPQPFLLPALQENKADILKSFEGLF